MYFHFHLNEKFFSSMNTKEDVMCYISSSVFKLEKVIHIKMGFNNLTQQDFAIRY